MTAFSHSASEVIHVFLTDASPPPFQFDGIADVHATVNLSILGTIVEAKSDGGLSSKILEDFYFDFQKQAYVLVLKKGLTFSDGVPVEAKDLAFTITRGFFSEKRDFFSGRFGNLRGIDRISPGEEFNLSRISEAVKILSPWKVEFYLNHPDPSFFYNLLSPYYGLTREDFMEKDYLNWKNYPKGFGDYQVASYQQEDQKMKLVKREQGNGAGPKEIHFYWGPKGSQIRDYDLSFPKLDGLEPQLMPLPAFMRIIEFSNLHPLGRSEVLRNYINTNLKRENFRRVDLGLEPSTQLLPRKFWGRLPEGGIGPFEKPESELKKLESFYIGIYNESESLSPTKKFLAEELVMQLKDLGFPVKGHKVVKEKFFFKETCEEIPLILVGRVTDYINPLVMFVAFLKDGHSPWTSVQEDFAPEFKSLFDRAHSAESLEGRIQRTQELSQFVFQHGVTVALAEEKKIFYLNKKRILSFGNQPNLFRIDFTQLEFAP